MAVKTVAQRLLARRQVEGFPHIPFRRAIANVSNSSKVISNAGGVV